VPNRLADESSPYLLQHRENPVDWYPWCDEALERARAQDRPILLSIGYSACHWCHVMERESFEDEDTARLMNEHFINIKVDREERPDVDAIYMRAVQSLTGHGGWPLTAFLTPDGRPFYGGTYFPPEPRHGLPSFRQILTAAAEAYRDRRDRVESSAEQIRELLARSTTQREPGTGRFEGSAALGDLTRHAVDHLRSRFDGGHGGFGGAPKFPQPDVLEFLLEAHVADGDPALLEMVVHTLVQMARGGIYDQLGGGFHRYSVDAEWLVPHFEKMLYDNGLLARLYTRAWQVSGEPLLREVAEGTLDYVLADLRDPGGGLYSARDADSEGEEGLFYLWSREEVADLLGPERATLFSAFYDVSPGGNFEGRNILNRPHELAAFAGAEGMGVDELEALLAECRQKLLERRATRKHPLRDEKVLVGWNAMALRALAVAGAVFGREDYLEAARAGCSFVLEEMRTDDGLLHVWTAGRARIPGFLEDHAGMGHALLSLHEATLEPRWLDEARRMLERSLERFWDAKAGVFWDSASEAEELVVRPRDISDNPTPSGNSLAVELLLRMGHLFGEAEWLGVAERVLEREAGAMERFPSGFGRLLAAGLWLQEPPREIAIVGDPSAPETGALLEAAWASAPGRRVLAGGPPDRLPPGPLFEGRGLVEGAPAAWVFQTRAPATVSTGKALASSSRAMPKTCAFGSSSSRCRATGKSTRSEA